MKVILGNGSPGKDGCTGTALAEAAGALASFDNQKVLTNFIR